MFLLGATAVEDKLQDLVPEAIEDFLEGGIKVCDQSQQHFLVLDNAAFC